MDVVCGPLKIKLGFLWHADYNEFYTHALHAIMQGMSK